MPARSMRLLGGLRWHGKTTYPWRVLHVSLPLGKGEQSNRSQRPWQGAHSSTLRFRAAIQRADANLSENSNPNGPREQLKMLVDQIILAQGNAFIKELLRNTGIRIGLTKADFERNLMRAVDDGVLRREHIEAWLDEVEGWGNQHIYLFKVPSALAKDPLWSDASKIRKKAAAAGFGDLWNAPSSFEFPETQKLTAVQFDGSNLRLTWHLGQSWLVRDKTKDYTEEIDGDVYEFHAHRRRAERAVMRFELALPLRIAAIFLQTPWGEVEHESALKEVVETTTSIFDFDVLEEYKVSLAIKHLDQMSLDDQQGQYGIQPSMARLDAPGAYIEFGSDGQKSYQDFTPVRDVRRALKPAYFTGNKSDFIFSSTTKNALSRKIRVSFYGKDARIRLWMQMKAQEVWEILRMIKAYG